MHSLALGPLQVRQDGSHGLHTASLVAVQMSLSNSPEAHVVHVSHTLCPVFAANVPAVQPMQVVEPGTD